jgi:hypothetical protein
LKSMEYSIYGKVMWNTVAAKERKRMLANRASRCDLVQRITFVGKDMEGSPEQKEQVKRQRPMLYTALIIT